MTTWRLAFRQVAHDREHHRFGKVPERVEHNMDRKRGAIRAPSYEVEAHAHLTHAWICFISHAVGDVTFSEMLRQQYLDWIRDESSHLLPERSAGLIIGIMYDSLGRLRHCLVALYIGGVIVGLSIGNIVSLPPPVIQHEFAPRPFASSASTQP
jgi:hypothetical protein